MRTPTIWAICLFMFVVAQSPRHLNANHIPFPTLNPITSFWFEVSVEQSAVFVVVTIPLFAFDLPINSLSESFVGGLPIWVDASMTDLICAECTVEYGPTFFVVDSIGSFTKDLAQGEWAVGTNTIVSDIPGDVSVLVLPHRSATAVPEPATSVLLLSGLVMGGLVNRKRAKEKRRSSRL